MKSHAKAKDKWMEEHLVLLGENPVREIHHSKFQIEIVL